MYCRKVNKEINFKLTKDEFNSFINNLTTTKENEDDMKVKVGVLVRTANTNEILVNKEEQGLLVSPININIHKGYFALINTIKDVLDTNFIDWRTITPEQVRQTVLMPIGYFIKDGECVIYFNLIIDDGIKSLFVNNLNSYNFKELTPNLLSNLNGYDIMIKDTLKIVK